MNRILTFSIFTIFVLTLVGCTPPKDITINDREEFVEKDATKVTMWVNDFEEWNNQINIDQRMDFNDISDDGIQLEQVFVDVNSFEDLIRSARETDSVPDIYMVSYGNLYKEVNNNFVADLTDLFTVDQWDDLVSNAKEGVTYDDKFYAYPILMEPSTLLFYRKDLLQKYGETDTIPTNWNDFTSLLEVIKTNIAKEGKRGLYPFDVPKGIGLSWGSWGFQLAATDGLAITEDWSSSRVLEPGYQDLAKLWDSLYKNSYVPLSSGDYTEVINDLCLDKLVMTTAGSWSIATIIKEYPDLINQIGVMAMPTFDGNQEKATATNGGWTYVISSNCKNKEEAAKVIDYLVAGNVEKPLEYFTKANFSKTPTRKSVQESISVSLENQNIVPKEWIEVLQNVSDNAKLEPIYPWDVSVVISTLLENAALGNNISAEQRNANDTIIDIIERENLVNKNPRG